MYSQKYYFVHSKSGNTAGVFLSLMKRLNPTSVTVFRNNEKVDLDAALNEITDALERSYLNVERKTERP